MNRYPVKRRQGTLREVKADPIEAIEPVRSFFTFRYTHTEISATDRKAHVKARQTRLEDGKLTTESFEGDIDRTVYDRMVADAQRYFVGQTMLLANSLSWFLPFLRSPRSDRD
jgi:hypothetical protein